MNQEIIEQAASSYADNIPQFDDRRRYCREDFIAGVEYLADHLCGIPFNEIIDELHEYCMDKLKTKQS